MNVTSSQRRKARQGKDLFLSTKERYESTLERLTKKRCEIRGLAYAPANFDYYKDGIYSEAGERLYESHEQCRRIRMSIRRLINSQEFVNKTMERAGFKFLGSGSFRHVYEDKDGTVYKFFNSKEYADTRDDNRNDVQVSRCWHRNKDSAPQDVREKFFIPVMRMAYGVVIAEKAKPQSSGGGDTWSADRPLADFMRKHGWIVNDTHGGNMWWDGERWCYVDLGHFRRIA